MVHGNTHTLWRKHLLPAAAAALFLSALLALIGAASGSQALAQTPNEDQARWGLVAGLVPTDTILYSMFMLDQNNAWLAGSDGNGQTGRVYRIQYANNAWRLLKGGALPAPVFALSAVSDDNVWAVGDKGLIAHKDASGWHVVPNPVPGVTLNTIQMFGTGAEGWAGGVVKGASTSDWQLVMLHYTHGAWHQDMTFPAVPSLSPGVVSLHFEGDTGYALGYGGIIWRYSGGQWRVDNAGPACSAILNGVRTTSRDEAWAVGYTTDPGPANPGMPVVCHRANGGWHGGLPDVAATDESTLRRVMWSRLYGVSFTPDGYGLAVGGGGDPNTFAPYTALILSYRADGKWHLDTTPDMQTALLSVSQVDAGHALAVGWNGIILSYGYGPGFAVPSPTPTITPIPPPAHYPSDPMSDPQNPLLTYFPVVGHTLAGGFRDYWDAHGGLAQFGYPITEEFREKSPTNGNVYTVQYFERARFEWHPENRPPYDVLLGLLGRTVTQGREHEPPFLPAQPNATPGYTYFAPSGHNMAPQFTAYWQSHGGLPVYGYPISEAFTEASPTDGKPYLVQYFERNRLEYHPELPEAYRVSLGLLGTEILRARGWIK